MENTNKTLIVVESPSKAKTISKYLGPDYTVRASYGHIFDLVGEGKNKLGVDIEKGFIPKYGLIPDKKDKLKVITDAAKSADLILLATDPDREGEGIACLLANSLKKMNIPIKRVLFHEITKKGVQEGISKPQELNKDLFEAQKARRVLDRLVGFLVSPFLIDALGPNLSAGRVQSVTLRLIVDREREIENFKPEEYWSITAALAKSKEKFVAKYANKVTNKEEALKIKKDLDTDTYQVIEVVAEEKAKKPLPSLVTATLQQVASSKYGISSDRAMKAAQTLYESGMVTYIRTDSVRCSPDSISDLRSWLKQNGHDVPAEPVKYVAKNNAQDAHEAIRPTDVKALPEKVNLSEDENKIYSLIWERFVASQMNPALYDTVAVTIKSSSGHILKANGRTLKSKGWLEIMKDFKDEEENKLPSLQKEDLLNLVSPKVKAEQKFTQPPSRYKNHSLIKELESRGIGRPSTYATILTKITDRGYVKKKGDTFFATDIGKQVVDMLIKFFDFMQYQYTANMEDKLDEIAEGKLDYLKMMNGFFPDFRKQLKKAISINEKDYGINCPVCQQSMWLKHGRFGFYMECANYPECNTTQSCEIIDNKPVLKVKNKMELIDDVECPKCSSKMFIKDGKFGKFYACSRYPKCTGSGKIPSGHLCDKCGYTMYITIFGGISKLACMGYPNCRTIRELPEGTSVDWVNPKQIEVKKNKIIEKILAKKLPQNDS